MNGWFDEWRGYAFDGMQELLIAISPEQLGQEDQESGPHECADDMDVFVEDVEDTECTNKTDNRESYGSGPTNEIVFPRLPVDIEESPPDRNGAEYGIEHKVGSIHDYNRGYQT